MLQDNASSSLSLEDYFYLEARERAYEIEIKSLKEFEKEKKRLFEIGKQAVIEDLDKKMKQIETAKKIQKSATINKSRVKKMNARNRAILKLLDQAELLIVQKLQEDPQSYENLMRKLIVQAFLKLLEQRVVVKCLEKDIGLVERILPSCKQLFKDIVKKELDIDFPIEATVNKNHFLELRKAIPKVTSNEDEVGDSARVPKNEEDRKCIGGVLVTNADGLIVCKNTIDIRLDLCFQDSLPMIRQLFFMED